MKPLKMKPLKLELTLEQEMELEKIKRAVTKLPRIELEEMVINLMQQNFSYRNAFRSVI